MQLGELVAAQIAKAHNELDKKMLMSF